MFCLATLFYTLVGMKSILFFSVALDIIICPPLCKGRWRGVCRDGGIVIKRKLNIDIVPNAKYHEKHDKREKTTLL